MTRDREYRDKPERGPIEREVLRLSRSQRARYKARVLRDARPSRAFSYNGIDIRITRAPRVNEKGQFEVWLEASRDGVPLPVDNPYLFVNPPTKVPDGTWRREEIDGEERDVRNMREDAAEAFRQMVGQAVERAG